jgi:hypothetical protein
VRLFLAADSTLDRVAGGSEDADVAVILPLINDSDLYCSFRDSKGKETLLMER